jgi:signal transduction histidine kinase
LAEEHHRTSIASNINKLEDIDDFEILLITKDQGNRLCVLTLSIEKNEQNEVYVQGIIHDITNIKKAEKATLQAEKLAAAGRLVRTLAHEVRNPLNNILLSVEQLMQQISDDEPQLYMNIIQRNSKRINDLITELLHTSRPSENNLKTQLLNEIIDEVLAAAIDRLTLKKIDLSLSYPQAPVFIAADRSNLKLALLNIVINAIEAMNEFNSALSIAVLAPRFGYCTLTIADNGCGISEENISRLFEPYFTQKRNGVGLGLTFSLNILQAHKAKIEVTSKQNHGTTFSIVFPIVDH